MKFMFRNIRERLTLHLIAFSTSVVMTPDIEYQRQLRSTSSVNIRYISPMVPEFATNILQGTIGTSCRIIVTPVIILLQPTLRMFVTYYE